MKRDSILLADFFTSVSSGAIIPCMTVWTCRSAVEIVEAVRSRKVTVRQVVSEHLDRIRALNPQLAAFRVICDSTALAEADALDGRADLDGLALAGVPVAVKDNIAVTGVSTRAGSRATSDEPAPADHPLVGRLRAAGAVVVGITAMPEFGLFNTTDTPHSTTRNPWDLSRTPGGSSGGSAAAVAAGLVPIAHANDGLGSIRTPAACCGLLGIKPGAGVVPPPFEDDRWFGLAENGCLTTTTQDAALVLSVMAGRPDLERLDGLATPLRIAVSTRPIAPGTAVNRAAVHAVRTTTAALVGLGHDVQDADPAYPLWLGPHVIALWAACAEAQLPDAQDHRDLQRRTRSLAGAGRVARALKLVRPHLRDKWIAHLQEFFTDHDLLITPMLAQAPPPALRWSERGALANVVAGSRYAPFAAPWNVAGYPAVSLPAGLDPRTGLPLAVQVVAPPGREDLLLALCAQVQAARPWPRLAPSYNDDPPPSYMSSTSEP